MARPVVNNGEGTGHHAANATSLTFAYNNTGPASGTLLLCAASASGNSGNNCQVTGITYAAAALTNDITNAYNTNAGCCSIRTKKDPATGSNNIVISASATSIGIHGAVQVYTGHDPTTPIRQTAVFDGTSSTGVAQIVAGDWSSNPLATSILVDLCASGVDINGHSEQEYWENNFSGSSVGDNCGSQHADPSGGSAPSLTYTQNGSDWAGMAAVEIQSPVETGGQGPSSPVNVAILGYFNGPGLVNAAWFDDWNANQPGIFDKTLIDQVGGNNVTGAIAGASVVSGTLSLSEAVAGAIAGASVVAGVLSVVKNVAGAIAGASVVSGAVTLAEAVAGAIAGASVVSGLLSVTKDVTGAIAGGSVVAGALTVLKDVAGTVAGASVVAGTLSVTKNVAGAIAGGSTVSGDVTSSGGTDIFVTGAIAGGSSVSGSITESAAISGAIAGTSSVTGDLSVAKNVAGALAGSSSVSGSILEFIDLTGLVAGSSNLAGVLSVSKSVAGLIAGRSVLAGVVTGGSGSTIVYVPIFIFDD